MAVRDPNSAAGISRLGDLVRRAPSVQLGVKVERIKSAVHAQVSLVPLVQVALDDLAVRTRLGRSAVGNAIQLRRPPTADIVLKRSGKGGGRLRFGLRPAWLRVRTHRAEAVNLRRMIEVTLL